MTEKTRSKQKYVNRDISWVEFNSRVLDEAADAGNPLVERLKFVAIFSGNLDEFYMVRVAGISQQLDAGAVSVEGGFDPAELLAQLDARIRKLAARQRRYLYADILPSLEREGVRIADWHSLDIAKRESLRRTFRNEYLPVLTPVGVDSSHPFPLVPNLGLELLVRLKKDGETRERFAMVEVPASMPRFIVAETSGENVALVTSESLIENNLDLLFNKCEILECSCFRISRDMDFYIDEEATDDLLEEIQTALRKKTRRRVVRVEVSAGMTKKSREWLCGHLAFESSLVFSHAGMLNLKDLFQLADIVSKPSLKAAPLPPLPSIHADANLSMFENIAKSDGGFLVHHPYESFDTVVRLLNEAAADPNVLAIKQTLYRVSGNSPVVNALIRAARNGKQVSVLVELKARFDEENNINWARELADAGAHVVYGIAGLKVHCKMLMIVRREAEGIHRYMHLGTGNYNDKTAKQYTDLGFFTDEKSIANDISALFNVITGFSASPQWNKILAAPFNIRERLIYMIDREAESSSAQNPGEITIKVNSLIDFEIIDHLYAAARKNVKINLIVRGICGINPWSLPAKAAKNIRVVSILDRFLEHARIYRFANFGDPSYYIGSSDIMPRNLRRRVEVLFPIEKQSLRKELDMILELQLNDRRKGRRLTAANTFSRTNKPTDPTAESSQLKLYKFYKKRYDDFVKEKAADKLPTVFESK